jgi:hypothetical protein
MQPRTLIDELEARQLFASLTAGQTYNTTLTSSSNQKNWSIDLVAGQNVTLAAGDLSDSALETELILISPAGKVLRRSVGDLGSFLSVNAPVEGTYRVRVRDVGRDNLGDVKVTAFFSQGSITDSDDAFAAQSGRRFAATIDPGDLDVWTLTATQAQFLAVGATENTSGSTLDIGVLVVDPSGHVVTGGENGAGVKFDIPNATRGNYYAVVYEAGADDDGRYGITFGRVPGVQYGGDPDTATQLQSGITRTGDMPGGDFDIFGIPLTAGQTFTATLSRGATGSLDPELLLINPQGQVVTTNNGKLSTVVTATIPTAGTWWLFARDREGDDGGAYTIKFTAK